jgi:transcriptional regulator with XRE-family HTH domain
MPKLDNLEEAVEAEIGERIRNRRAVLGMSQAELADRIGMSFQQVQKYERGANRIASSILVRVADALNCAPGDLLSSHKSKGRGSSAVDREIDAIASRIKMLKSAPARKKILAAVTAMLADTETATKPAKPTAPKKAAAKAKAKAKPAPAKAAAKKRKPSR